MLTTNKYFSNHHILANQTEKLLHSCIAISAHTMHRFEEQPDNRLEMECIDI